MAYYSYAWQLDDITRQQYIASLGAIDSTGASGAAGDAPGGNLTEYFTYVEQYVPSPAKVRKNKYGMVKYEPYWLKTFRMKTAPMENVLGPEKEIIEPIDEGEFYASDFASDDSLGISLGMDSLAVGADSLAFAADSLGAVPQSVAAVPPEDQGPKYRFRYDPEDNFNVEQDYYNKYFGELLLDRSRPPAKVPADSLAGGEVLPDSLLTEKGFMAGLKNLFKKKNKDLIEEDPGLDEGALLEEDPLIEEEEEEPQEEGQEGQ